MTGRFRIVRQDGHELRVQPSDEGFTFTMFDDMGRTIAMDLTKVESGAVSNYLLEALPFSECDPGNVLTFMENDAESEIRSVFRERMGAENGWSDALSDVISILHRVFEGLSEGGER